MTRSRPLTYDEFLTEAVPRIRRVFANPGSLDEPFRPDIPRRMILFQEYLYSLDNAQFASLAAAAKSVGDTKFYEAPIELRATAAPMAGRPLDPKHELDYAKNPAYVFFVDEPSVYLERAAPFNIPSWETALVSGSGKWGFLFSHENVVLVGGSEQFMSTLLDSYPGMEVFLDWEGQERATVPSTEQVRLFLDDIQAWRRTDEEWLQSYLRHIYGNEEAERLLRDAQSRPKPKWRFPHEKHSWRFSHQQLSGSTPRRWQGWRPPATSPPASADLALTGDSTVEPAEAVVFYPLNRWAWGFFALFCTVLFVFSLSGLFDPRAPGWGNHLVFAGCLLFFGALAFPSWRQTLRPRPTLRLDQDGFECAQGRVPWTDVEGFQLVQRGWGENTYQRLQFLLRAGATPLSTDSPYFKGLPSFRTKLRGMHRPRRHASGLIEVGVGWRPDRALVAARRFYAEYRDGAHATSW